MALVDPTPFSRRRFLTWTAVGGIVPAVAAAACARDTGRSLTANRSPGPVVALPSVAAATQVSLQAALLSRRSVRSFTSEAVTPEAVSVLLWAAQGITHDGRLRTAPSAGALYALEMYAALPDTTVRYVPDGHRAQTWASTDLRPALADASGRQDSLVHAPLVVVVTTTWSRLASRYGVRAARFADMEAGHATQNLLLQAVALRLGAVCVGSFDDGAVADVLDLPDGEEARYLVAVGHPA